MKDNNTYSGLAAADFQQVVDGKETSLYVLRNQSGAELAITNYGAKIVSLMVPDRTGNWMTGHFEGKPGQRYPERAALCLETQHFPDSPNRPEYPSTLLRPGETFASTTIYKFNVE